MRRLVFPFRFCAALVLAGVVAAGVQRAASSGQPSIEELKARVDTAAVGDRPKLCMQIAERQLKEADKQYTAGDSEKGHAALTDVITFSEQARDYSIQTHRHEKQTEIAVRGMTRKLNDLLHTLAHDDQPPVEDAVKHLQRVRDDLLTSMFPKGAK
jgi:hypothetical protein